jgi:hypothetical protein
MAPVNIAPIVPSSVLFKLVIRRRSFIRLLFTDPRSYVKLGSYEVMKLRMEIFSFPSFLTSSLRAVYFRRSVLAGFRPLDHYRPA